MALSKEDKADVKGAFGKALANKVEKATKDRLSQQDREDKITSRMVKRLRQREKGRKLTRNFLD